MKNRQTILSCLLATCCWSLGCDTPPNMMKPNADPMPTATPSPAPLPDPATGSEVIPHCEMRTLDPDLLIEKSGSGETIADMRIAANDTSFALAWRNNQSEMPTMFRSFGWDLKPTSDVVHLGDMSLNWGNGLIGGTDDYLTVASKFESGIENPPQPFKYNFRRVSASGELRGEYSQLQFGERDPSPNVIFDGKYYRITNMHKVPVGCPTQLSSWQVGVTGALIHDTTKCIYLGDDDPVNASIRSVLPTGDDVLVAYDHHVGGSALGGSIKITSLKGLFDWEPVSVLSSFTFLEGVYNTGIGMKMLWLKGGERFISSLDDGKITMSYRPDDPLFMPQIDGNSMYGLYFNQLDNTAVFLRTDLNGKTMSKIDLKSPIADPSLAMAGRSGKFVVAVYSWWNYKKPELRTISCQ